MNEENLIFIDRLIKDRPDYFKQVIIDHCRKMDKYDVYEWIANDEIKIQQLHKENQQLKDNWNELKKYAEENLYFYSGLQGEDREEDTSIKDILDKMQELEGDEE